MEILFIGLVPVLFLLLGIVMMSVSQVSGFFTFVRYSNRQRGSNRAIAGFIRNLAAAKTQLGRRSQELAGLSERLAQGNQELERLNMMKTRFLSMAAHDVRTPLATMRGYLDMLPERSLEGRARRAVQGIRAANVVVDRLVSDLTDLAVIEAGKLRMEPAPFEVQELAAELLQRHSLLAARKGVALTARSGARGAVIIGDRFRLGQALGNLIANALKFVPRGGQVSLSVTAERDGVLFMVADTGPGIHPAEKRRIFESFYQSQRSQPQEGRRGWGLGLSIASEIVKAHGGEIGVESPGPGQGSVFWVRVPPRPPVPEAPRRRKALAGMAVLALALGSGPAGAQTPAGPFPLEEKARFDRYMEDKAETVLLRMLGPNRAKIVVDATLDLTRIERFDVRMGARTAESEGQASVYSWQNVTARPSDSRELLPGIPLTPDGGGAPQSYERQFGFPARLVKRLAVTIVLDRSVSQEQADVVQSIVSDLLEVDPNRGDAMTVVRTAFAPAWKTFWYSQDSFSAVLKYTLLTMMTLITLIVVASCFLKLASSMDSMARAQTQQYAMDVGMRGEEAGGPPALPGAAPSEDAAGTEGGRPLRVRPDQIPILVEMMRGQDPDNAALVASFLEPEPRRIFLASLPEAAAAEVLLRLARVRFVEPELAEKIKEELERRLSGAVGGLSRVHDAIASVPPRRQRELLLELHSRDPGLYEELRPRVLFLEDLAGLEPQDWPILMGRTRLEDWASALQEAPESLSEALKANVLPKTWEIIEQTRRAYTLPPERVEAAQAAVLMEARRLVAEGRVRNPVRPPVASRQEAVA